MHVHVHVHCKLLSQFSYMLDFTHTCICNHTVVHKCVACLNYGKSIYMYMVILPILWGLRSVSALLHWGVWSMTTVLWHALHVIIIIIIISVMRLINCTVLQIALARNQTSQNQSSCEGLLPQRDSACPSWSRVTHNLLSVGHAPLPWHAHCVSDVFQDIKLFPAPIPCADKTNSRLTASIC